MTTATRDGTISWIDLSTPDVDGAQRFYAELLGWKMATQHTGMGDYTIGSVGDHEVAGMMAQPAEMAGQPAMWTTFVVVDDIDATLGRVADAGGTVVQAPSDIPGGAQVAVFTDSTGAMLALISGGPEPGIYYSTDPGAVCWAELMTRQPEPAMAFYQAVFGWTADRSDLEESAGVDYTVFTLGDEQVAGMITTPDHLPAEVPDTWSIYFSVTDCDATVERTTKLGGSVVLGSTRTPMGPFAVLADPTGAVFEVMEMAVPG